MHASRGRRKVSSGVFDPSAAEIAAINMNLITAYHLQPIIMQHYLLPSALKQKIGALIHRTETQARDVIDLHLLAGLYGKKVSDLILNSERTAALETLMSVTYDDFRSQVWPFLMTEYQEIYSGKKHWNDLQEKVAGLLEGGSAGES